MNDRPPAQAGDRIRLTGPTSTNALPFGDEREGISVSRRDARSLSRWRGRESGERIGIERARLPRLLVPRTLVANHLHGHDDPVAAELVARGDAVVEAAIGIHRELDGARQTMHDQDLHFVLAGVFGDGETRIVAFLARVVLVHAQKRALGSAPLILRGLPFRSLIAGGDALAAVLALIEQAAFDRRRRAA